MTHPCWTRKDAGYDGLLWCSRKKRRRTVVGKTLIRRDCRSSPDSTEREDGRTTRKAGTMRITVIPGGILEDLALRLQESLEPTTSTDHLNATIATMMIAGETILSTAERKTAEEEAVEVAITTDPSRIRMVRIAKSISELSNGPVLTISTVCRRS